MLASSAVLSNDDLFNKIYEYSKPVFEDKFTPLLKDANFDDLYDDYEYLQQTMFVEKLLEQLKENRNVANAKHGYMYHYGGDGSAWGNAFDILKDAYRITTPSFQMKFYSTDEPFEWTIDSGKRWLQDNFEKYYNNMLEIASIDSTVSENDIADESPDFWGDLEIEITITNHKERIEAICWLEEYIKVADRINT